MESVLKRLQVTVIVVALALFASLSGDGQSLTRIVIMHTNDLHGQLLPRAEVGGFAEIATIVRGAKPDLLLDAGDMFTGTPVCDEFRGRPIIEVMNKLGYRAVALGNHEFDYGVDALQQRVREAKFPILTANLNTGIDGIGQTTVLPVRGLRIGVIGLTTAKLAEVAHPKNLTKVRVEDVVKAVERVLPALRNRIDFVILLTHIDDDEEMALAKAFPEIRLIISGHNHSALGPIWIGNTMVAKTGSTGRNVGRVELHFRGKTLEQIRGELLPVRNVKPDAEIAGIIKPYADKVNERMSIPIGEATDEIASSNTSESALANLIADALRAKTGTAIALQNLGGIRARIRQGMITRGDVFEVMPFNNTVVTMSLSGRLVKQTLARGLMAISGLRIEYAPKRPAGQRLISATLIDGTPIRDEVYYSVTFNDFLLTGGDGFVELSQSKDVRDTDILLRDALADHIASRPRIYPALDGRIRITP